MNTLQAGLATTSYLVFYLQISKEVYSLHISHIQQSLIFTKTSKL